MQTLDIWHDMVRRQTLDRLDEILAEDCVFLSPIVHSPQQGKDLTAMYLTGALNVFDNARVFLRVDQPGAPAATCNHYSVSYQF